MDIEYEKGRMINLADELGVTRTWLALRKWSLANELRQLFTDDAIDLDEAISVAAHDDEIEDIRREALDAAKIEDAISANVDRLHEAICEGRRQDAIDILNEITGDRLRSVREQRNLFPDRVPA